MKPGESIGIASTLA